MVLVQGQHGVRVGGEYNIPSNCLDLELPMVLVQGQHGVRVGWGEHSIPSYCIDLK